MTGRLASTKNPLVKRIRGLAERANRKTEGKMAVEGVRLVEAALAARTSAELLLYDPDARAAHPRLDQLVAQAQAMGIRTIEASRHVIEACSQVETPQGILAVIHAPRTDLADILGQGTLLLVIADRVQDPGNLGTLVRVADAAGASAVAVTPGSADPHTPKVVRATMGSLFHLPVVEADSGELVRALKSRSVRVLVADQRGTIDYSAASYAPPVALVLGGEAAGVDARWQEAADTSVRIPLYGRAESLNVAIAAALLLYEARRAQEG